MDLASVNFDTAEDVTDIEPEPTIAISENEHHFASIGYEAKRQLLMLLDETDPEEPLSTRVFERLGVPYQHASWRDYDLYWADDEEAFVEALRDWHQTREASS